MSRQLISNTEVLAEMLQDPQFRAEWERTALARAVAEAVIRYRAERGLSQTALARLLGWRQPVVARLEAAEHNPTMDTLLTLGPHARPAVCRWMSKPEGWRGRQGHQVPGSLMSRPAALRQCALALGGLPPAPSGLAAPQAPSQPTDAASHSIEAGRWAQDPVAKEPSSSARAQPARCGRVSCAASWPGSRSTAASTPDPGCDLMSAPRDGEQGVRGNGHARSPSDPAAGPGMDWAKRGGRRPSCRAAVLRG